MSTAFAFLLRLAVAAVFLIGEAVADAQMFAFQTEKYRRRAAGEPAGDAYARGFIETGLWAYSRHPNYFCEVSLWWAFYLFAVAATGDAAHWSACGAVFLTLLFVPPGASPKYAPFRCGDRSHFAQGLRDAEGLPDRQLLESASPPRAGEKKS